MNNMYKLQKLEQCPENSLVIWKEQKIRFVGIRGERAVCCTQYYPIHTYALDPDTEVIFVAKLS